MKSTPPVVEFPLLQASHSRPVVAPFLAVGESKECPKSAPGAEEQCGSNKIQ